MGPSNAGLTANPKLTLGRAAELLRTHWGIDGELSDLGSLQDQNFLVLDPSGARTVLKIAASDDGAAIALQHAVLRHLAGRRAGFDSPVPVPTRDGRAAVTADGCDLHLLSWVPGVPMAARAAMTDADLAGVGVLCARATLALADFVHPGMDRDLLWDVRRAGAVVAALRTGAEDEPTRALLDAAEAAFTSVARDAKSLPMQVVHTDVTPGNAVCRRDPGGWAPTGILDFGDVTRTWRVADIVGTAADVAGAEGTDDVVYAVGCVLAAYQSVCPLVEAEVEAIWPLVLARTAVTFVVSAEQVRLTGGNEYAGQSAVEGLRALARLCEVPARLAVAALRECVGLEPAPSVRQAAARLAAAHPTPMLAGLDSGRAGFLDLSVTSDVYARGEWLDGDAVAGLVGDAELTVSRWGECRLADARGPGRTSPDNLHLAVEVYVRDTVEVCAPIDATVHAVSASELILDLRPGGGELFLAVHGPEPVAGLGAGDTVVAGAVLGTARPGADARPARLAIQLRAEPELPRLGRPNLRAAWLALCPDPSVLLGLDVAAPPPVPAEHSRAARDAHVARAQHLYYERPVEIARGWRHFLYDADGRPYLDMINNIASVGHSHPRITQAATRQFRLLNTNSRFMYSSMERYSSRVAELLPPELDSVFLVNSGSEAADLALQLARVFTRRRDVIALQGAYHGWTGSVLALCSSPQDRPDWREQLEPWMHLAEQPDPYRGRFGADPAGYCESVRAACAAAERAGGLAAFVCEPLLGNQGAVEPPPGYLAAAYAVVREAGGLCVADEVQVGMGRTGEHFWAFEHEQVVPDIVYTAKATGNGHPLGVVACRRDIADTFDAHACYFSSTGGGPVSCEVGLAVLDVIRDEGLQQNALAVGSYLTEGLVELAGRHELIGAVHGRGLYQGVDLVSDRRSKAPAVDEAMRVSEHLRQLGVIMQPTGDAFNVLKIKPPLCLDRAGADYFLATLDTALGAAG